MTWNLVGLNEDTHIGFYASVLWWLTSSHNCLTDFRWVCSSLEGL